MFSVLDITLEDLNKIDENGYYANITKNVFFDLSDKQIMELRQRFPNRFIAKNRVINVGKKYRLSKKNHFLSLGKEKNRGFLAAKVVVGGVVVSLSVAAFSSLFVYANKTESQEVEVVYIGDFNLNKENNIEESSDTTFEEETLCEEEYSEEVEETKQERLIRKYCAIYQVDFDIVYTRLSELTDNFSSASYLNDLHIDGVKCKGKEVYASTEEELILLAVRCIKQKPELMGLDSALIISRTDYESGMDYAKQISEISQVLGMDRALIYSIVQAETSFNSSLFLEKNNPAGLKDGKGEWWKFANSYEGFIELCLEVRKFNDMGAYSIEEIGSIHAPVEDGNENWVPNVTGTYDEVKANENLIFGVDNEISTSYVSRR